MNNTYKNFRVEQSSQHGDKVIFIFTAMGTKIWLYRLFLLLLKRRGYTTVIYDYPPKLLFDANFTEWDKFYEEIIADAQQRLTKFEQYGIHKFYCYGASMGTLLANKFARLTPQVSHVILNLTYGDVADTVWSWKGTRKTKKSLQAQGIGIDGLRANLAHVDPIANASQLKGKKVLLFLSKADKVLLYEKTQHTKAAMEAAGIELQYVENQRLGHYPAAAKNSLQIKRLDAFLSS